MKIGKATVPRTSICTSDEHTIVVRGRDLSKELIGKVSFVEHFFLLLTGRLPSAGEAAVLNATLVAIAEHGLVPSVQAARMTFAAAPDAMQGAVAAGILGCGSVVLGSSETAGRMYSEIDAQVQAGSAIDAAALAVMKALARRRQVDPGLRPSAAQGARRARRRALRRRARGRHRPALRRHRRGRRGADARGAEEGPEAQRLGRDPGGAARRRLSGPGAEGRADPGAHRRPDRPPVRGDRPADRLRALVPGDARDGIRRRAAGRLRRTR